MAVILTTALVCQGRVFFRWGAAAQSLLLQPGSIITGTVYRHDGTSVPSLVGASIP